MSDILGLIGLSMSCSKTLCNALKANLIPLFVRLAGVVDATVTPPRTWNQLAKYKSPSGGKKNECNL